MIAKPRLANPQPVAFMSACKALLHSARTAEDAAALDEVCRALMGSAQMMEEREIAAFVTMALHRAAQLRGPVGQA